MKVPNILVIGDIMLDHYLWGSADRISPEAPVPVVNIEKESFSLGGAANVANNLVNMGARTTLLGALGNDNNGTRIQKLLEDNLIESDCILTDMQTTTKVRVVSQRHQMIRLDWEDNCNYEDLLSQRFTESIQLQKPEIILVSDYAKGVCSPGFLNSLVEYSRKNKVNLLIDPKGNNWNKYKGAFLVKPNLKELEDVMGVAIPNEDLAIEIASKKLLQQFNIKCLVITRGSRGVSVVTEKDVEHIEAIPVDVFDVSGAGDTVLASLAFHLARGKSLLEATRMANLAASKVVSRFGVVVSE